MDLDVEVFMLFNRGDEFLEFHLGLPDVLGGFFKEIVVDLKADVLLLEEVFAVFLYPFLVYIIDVFVNYFPQ